MSQPWGGSGDTGQAPGIPPLVSVLPELAEGCPGMWVAFVFYNCGRTEHGGSKTEEMFIHGALSLISSKHPSAAAPL